MNNTDSHANKTGRQPDRHTRLPSGPKKYKSTNSVFLISAEILGVKVHTVTNVIQTNRQRQRQTDRQIDRQTQI